MVKEKREGKGVPAIILLPVAAALGLGGIFMLAAMAGVAPPGVANLRGRVTDANTGNPISGALVTVNGLQTYTDAAGDYSFAELNTGSYQIRAEKEGYQMASGDIVLVAGDNVVDIQMTPGVALARLFGTVTDAQTVNAIAGVKVTIDGLVAYTDSLGQYLFEGLTPGGYTITFEKEGYETVIR